MSGDVIGRGIIQVEADASKLKAGIDDAKRSIRGLGKASADETTRSSQSIDRYIKKLQQQVATQGMSTRETKLYELSMRGASAMQLEAARSALNLSEAYERSVARQTALRNGLTALAAAAGAFAGSTIAAFNNAARAIDDFNDLADATGSSVENISALDAVARRTGGTFQTVETSLVRFNSALKDAKPDSDVARVLDAIGLSATELRRLDPAEALLKTAAALNGYANDGDKARAVQELFGKSLKEVAPFLKDLAEQGKLVAVNTREQAEEAEKYRKNLFALQATIGDLTRSIANDLLPMVNQTIATFRQGAADGKSFFQTLREEQLKLIGLGPRGPADEIREIGEALAFLEQKQASGKGTEATAQRIAVLTARLNELTAATKTATVAASAAGGGRGFVNPDPVRPSISIAEPVKKEKVPKATTSSVSEAQRYLEQLQRQAESVENLTTLERTLLDIRKGRLDGLTPALHGEIIAQAKLVDGLTYEADQRQRLQDAMQEALQDRIRSAEAAASEAESLRAANDSLALEIPTIGRSAAALYEQEQARIASAIAAAEARLASLELTDSIGMETLAVRDQIAELERRRGLLSDKRGAEAFAEQARQMQEVGQRARDALEGTLGQGFEDALDGNFKNIGDYFKRMLDRMVADALAAEVADKIFGKRPGGGSGSGDVLGSLFNTIGSFITGGGGGGGINGGSILPDILRGGRAIGGPVSAGGAYQVNERGPELLEIGGRHILMMGNQGGKVTPAATSGSRNVVINITINVPPNTSRDSAAQVAARTGAAVQRALARDA